MLATTYGHRFFVKADQETYDFNKTDLTNDYEYHDLDLSGIIPVGTVAVLLWGVIKGDVADSELSIAKAGYSGNKLKFQLYQSVANQAEGFSTIIPVSSDRKIKYKLSYVNWEFVSFSFVGLFA